MDKREKERSGDEKEKSKKRAVESDEKLLPKLELGPLEHRNAAERYELDSHLLLEEKSGQGMPIFVKHDRDDDDADPNHRSDQAAAIQPADNGGKKPKKGMDG